LKPRYVLVHLDTRTSNISKYQSDLRGTYQNWAGSFELGYGDAWNSSDNLLHCSSSETGLKCYNNAKHGFTLSKKGTKSF
jgi:hypothetical protein